jgi:hypothetical protein
LNGFSPAQCLDVAQQYVIGYNGSSLFWQVNNWKVDPSSSNDFTVLINDYADLAKVLGHKVPAGYWRDASSLEVIHSSRRVGSRPANTSIAALGGHEDSIAL